MSFNGALQVGRSAIVASQTAIQVAGNNMANAATEGYHRRSVHLTPLRGELVGRNQIVGRGVQLLSIRREIDVSLQARLRDSISSEHNALIDQRFLTSIETLQNELTENDLSSLLSDFFNSFSELANNPEDSAVRSVVIQGGSGLADRIASLRTGYQDVRREIDRGLGDAVVQVNDLLERISLINVQIAESEGIDGTSANSLRDQRDLLIDEVAEFLDITVVEQANGVADILVSSIPVVLASESRGIELRTESDGNTIEVTLRVAEDGTLLNAESGRIGGLLEQREQTVEPAIETLDDFARQLIFQVNRLHAQGQGTKGFDSIEAFYPVGDPDATLNSVDAGLEYRVENGSFFIHMTHAESGARTEHQVNVDGDAMSLNDFIAAINAAVPNLTASTGVGNRLTLTAADGYELSFSDDSRGALAALGINNYFEGSFAADIAVSQRLLDDPALLSVGSDHIPGSNDTALALANLQDQAIDELDGATIREFWLESVNDLAARTDAANDRVEATIIVRESLVAQIQSVSGVSIDEESINLLTFQRQFQAAARFINVIDETLQTLLSLLR